MSGSRIAVNIYLFDVVCAEKVAQRREIHSLLFRGPRTIQVLLSLVKVVDTEHFQKIGIVIVIHRAYELESQNGL